MSQGRKFAVAIAAALCCAALPGSAMAGQVVFQNSCKFTLHVPGFFGGTNTESVIDQGAVFNEDEHRKFCGKTRSHTPFGDATSTRCLAIEGGKIVSVSGGATSLDDFVGSDCIAAVASVMATTFDKTTFAPWTGTGTASLRGQAFLKTVGGDVKTCAGETVYLYPATTYFEEFLSKRRSGISMTADPKTVSLFRTTICDAQGNFSFASLPAQRWILSTKVTWGVPHIDPYADSSAVSTDLQGGNLSKEVSLQAGENQVFLTDRDSE